MRPLSSVPATAGSPPQPHWPGAEPGCWFWNDTTYPVDAPRAFAGAGSNSRSPSINSPASAPGSRAPSGTPAEPGVLNKLEFVEMENLFRFIVPDKVDLTLPANRAGIIRVLLERFPDEKGGIERFFDLVYRFFQEVISAFYLRDPEVTPEKYPLYFQYAFRDSQSVIDEYFRDPYLKLTVAGYWGYMGLPPRLLAFSDLAALIFAYIEFKPWHLKGGSQALSNAMAAAVLDAGGEIRFSCGAERIVTRDGAVQAVVTDRGEEITTRYVVSNASGVATFAGLLDDGEKRKEALKEVRGRWWVLHFSRFTRVSGAPRRRLHHGDDQLHLHLHRHGPRLRPLPNPRRE